MGFNSGFKGLTHTGGVNLSRPLKVTKSTYKYRFQGNRCPWLWSI